MADNASPLILLTRPQAQSERFAAMLDGMAETRIVPLQRIVPTGDVPPLDRFRGLIFTSENAVRLYADAVPDRSLVAWCVGSRTAAAASEAGLRVEIAGGSADALVEAILAASVATPLLHLHGRHTRGSVAARLIAEGVQTEAAEIYDQCTIAPEIDLTALLSGRRVLAPLFSPRSAQLLAAHITEIEAQWRFPCLSVAVRSALPENLQPQASVAAETTAKAMVSLLRRHISP